MCLSCFNAPSPTYLRPGHPSWPSGWVSGIGIDSVKLIDSELKASHLNGIQCPFFLSDELRRKWLSVCSDEKFKIALFLRYQDMPVSGSVDRQRFIRDELHSWARINGGEFPVAVIPAIRCAESVPDTLSLEIGKIAKETVPGMLVFHQTVIKNHTKAAGISLLSDSEHGESINIVVFTPEVQSVQPDSLAQCVSALNANAVIWDQWPCLSQDFRIKIPKIQETLTAVYQR